MLGSYAIGYISGLYSIYHSPKSRRLKTEIWLALSRFTFLALLDHYFGFRIKHARFLGFRVEFNNFQEFFSLFSLIFVHRAYYFESAEKQPFIIDGGSNIGLSILFFKHIHPRARICGFEPAPASFDLLQRNVRANSLQEVTLNQNALFDQEQEMEIIVPRDRPACPGVSIFPEILSGVKSEKDKIKVKAVPLSSYVTGPVDFLKLDIEGAEDWVLRELAGKNRLKMVRQIIMEYHHHTEPGREKLADLLKLLEDNGFGYQLHANCLPLARKNALQGILIYAYQKK